MTFEVVKIKSPYHALFGRLAYAGFMAWPCYVYLKLKIPGPEGTITVDGDRKIALKCEETDAAYAESACAAEELKFYTTNVDPANMTSLKNPTTEYDPPFKFKSAEYTRQVDFTPGDSSQKFTIRLALTQNKEVHSLRSSMRIETFLHGNLLTCLVY